jgi:outer membrane protein OmpA-like peptidoglycan-associated protein
VADLLGSDPDLGEVSTATRDRRRRRVLTAPILAIALLVPLAGSAHADQNEDLARLRSADTSASMLADSVVDLSGRPKADSVLKLNAADSALKLNAVDSVTGLKKTEKSAGTSVVTLTSDLLFEFGKAALTPASTAAIPDVAKGIARGAAVAVDGYTDSLGRDAINVPLSRRRAQAVAAALAVTRPDLVLTVAGHGSASEVAPNQTDGKDNPVGRAQNRRVTLTYAAH